MKIRQFILGYLCAAILGPALAQQYPTRPIRLIVPVAPGSSTNDVLSRALADRLSRALGQQIVVDNRPGAAGHIGSELVAKSAPDGYTLLIGINGTLAIGPSIHSNLGYVPTRDLAAVAMIASSPFVLVVNPSFPAKNVKELIAVARSKPGQLNFAASGNGTGTHMCAELFKAAAGIDALHVPYKGGSLAVTDLMAGQVHLYCTGLPAVLSQIKSGKLRALGMASLQRSALMPELPTIAEQQLPGFEMNTWTAVFAPSRTPEPVIRRLYGEIARIMNDEEMKSFVLNQGAEPVLMDPAAMGAYLKAETAKWAKVVKAAKIKAD
jgi:tripartite-type tricarboxylate transporter receptor subunit TctC